MQLEIKFKSIAFKWFFNVFLVVAITICAAAIAFSVVYTSIQAERIEVLATDYTYEFSALSSTDKNTFTDTAISIAGSFKYKNNLEKELLLSVLIQGCFRTFLAYEKEDAKEVLHILGDINDCLMQQYR